MTSDKAAALLKKLVLRLDDGTLIKAGGEGTDAATVMKPAEAYGVGSLTEAHLLKAQALLCEVHAKLPEEGPLRSLSMGSKRSVDTGYHHAEVGPTVSGKRSRSMGGAYANGVDDFLESPTSGALPPAPSGVPLSHMQPPMAAAPIRIVDNLIKILGPIDSPIFFNEVDPVAVPDYYVVVKRPVCLKQIRQRLHTGAYGSPQDFYADMDQLVYNCLLYNPVGTYVRQLGQKIEQRWLDNWRRNPILAQYQAGPAGGHRVPRTTSVNSYKNYQALPAEAQAALAEALQDEGVLASKMDGVVAILQRANQLPTNEEGEVELDLSVLSPGVVWELYEYVIGKPPPGSAAAAAQPARSSFQLQEDSDYDPHWRGFAAAPPGSSGGGGGGGGDGTKVASTEQAGQQLADEPQQRHEQQDQKKEEKQADAAAKATADEAASSAADGAAGQGQPGGDGSADQAGSTQAPPSWTIDKDNPELQKYIQQLKQLKGSTTLQKQQAGSEPTLLDGILQATVAKWVQGWIANFVRGRIETEFDVTEFVEGAKDALYTVHELLAEEDWEGLKPMMSAKLLTAWRDTAAEYRAQGFVWRTQLGPEPWLGGLRGLGFINKAQMEDYDPAIASLAPDVPPLSAAPTGMFMVLTVSLKVEQLTTISREDGKVVAELKDLRPLSWKFATGPLPGELPVDQLGTPWFLLSI
ncbi:Swr1 complex bromodomain subunit Brf1 isoform A [Micractinium conductrix]|uniref:Swr1 complex bromodomain subunit Brf1 isoform A n=1 Tax=Micractinium conductrix TaxID=554055 RepID=A0A2P6VKJ1_9CHLO|nr:Swr1 complex bromodomain subunit Brf1 isoform A [Micractinium conductrix]|eukprot:PSC74594.1 Swr1 complex bromodomain subunit Brf1 isoform A [Micractinium conductrix]